MDADQGVEAFDVIDLKAAIPVRYDVFTSSLAELLDAAAAAGIEERIRPLERGETHTFR